jgi:hypothetical protein
MLMRAQRDVQKEERSKRIRRSFLLQHGNQLSPTLKRAYNYQREPKRAYASRMEANTNARQPRQPAPTPAVWRQPPWLLGAVPTMAPTPFFLNPINEFLAEGKAVSSRPNYHQAQKVPTPMPTHFAPDALNKFLLPAEQLAISNKLQSQKSKSTLAPTPYDNTVLGDFLIQGERSSDNSAEALAAMLVSSPRKSEFPTNYPTQQPTEGYADLMKMPAIQRREYITREQIRKERTENGVYRLESSAPSSTPKFNSKMLRLLHGIHRKKHKP